jgi:hypothetical protein
MGSFAENVRDRGGRMARPTAVPRFGVVMGARGSAAGGNEAVTGEQSRYGRYGGASAESQHEHGGHGRGGNVGHRDNVGSGYRSDARRENAPQGVAGQQSDTRRNQSRQFQSSSGNERGGDLQRDQGQRDGQREFHSVHVYGGKAALCFGADETRGQGHTVRVEAAPSKGQRAYEWNEKISLQFTVKELTKVLCVLMGWLQEVEFQAHGPANDKAIALKNQEGGKVFINLRQGKTARAVPVMAEDVFGIIDLVIKQMLKNSPHLTADALLATVRAMAARFKDGG